MKYILWSLLYFGILNTEHRVTTKIGNNIQSTS